MTALKNHYAKAPSARKRTSKLYEFSLSRSWWVFVFLGLCYWLYSHEMEKKQRIYMQLQHRLAEMQQEKAVALKIKEDLLLQINSQSDPAWIEMTLMKGLGVVPEGQTKVYFTKDVE
jgi:hypothetical protein